MSTRRTLESSEAAGLPVVAGGTVGDVGNAVWPVAQHVNDVVGALRLAVVGECESLKHDQGAGSADGDDAADMLALRVWPSQDPR